ncbi:hypothetical protein NIES593_13495 [Hydrococcus rivularis NIES-593]|uniref:Uncharacterized protein n=1 Tax=Hydrococcus rivularis NIES-593 TaxID=1921803 RepID=A0A1U7HF80_9CYAN|nr:hypothetical protein [Hydrococcus rivularis]OKH22205.1 hypothetical protein NIES593_13495 [Hydrococcus rivularis NIES-593]
MARINPYSLRMQIGRMFEQGQSFFCTIKVHDWLKERNQDPNAYDIIFHPQPAPPGANMRTMVEIELRRKDGQPVDPWLQEEINRYA